jgi:hypothetical protein
MATRTRTVEFEALRAAYKANVSLGIIRKDDYYDDLEEAEASSVRSSQNKNNSQSQFTFSF